MITNVTSRSRLLLAACAIALVVLAPGCSRGARQPAGDGSRVTTSLAGSPVSSAPEATTAPEVAPGESVSERTMPYAKRKASMPAGLPIEIPVIDGSVTSTSAAVSDTSWVYTLETSGSVATVGDWYARAYANAQWEAVSHASADDGLSLTFQKHAAQSRIDVRALPKGKVEVRAAIGVGSPAPSTN